MTTEYRNSAKNQDTLAQIRAQRESQIQNARRSARIAKLKSVRANPTIPQPRKIIVRCNKCKTVAVCLYYRKSGVTPTGVPTTKCAYLCEPCVDGAVKLWTNNTLVGFDFSEKMDILSQLADGIVHALPEVVAHLTTNTKKVFNLE
jgi:hypothetical protein